MSSQYLNLFDFIEEHQASLHPPVCNKMVFNMGKLRIMIIGGPNQRKDYHLNQGEEIFYQLKGHMCVKVMECGAPKDVVIQEGEFFVLPGKIAHSPQRFENTLGIVVERDRPDDELDGLRYYTDESNQTVLWQRFFHVTDLGTQLVPLIKEFFSSEEYKTRVPADDMPKNAWELDSTTLLPQPFLLEPRFAELSGGNPVRLANKEFVVDLVGGHTKTPPLPIETEVWVWLLNGDGKVIVNGDEAHPMTRGGDTVLLSGGLTDLVVSDGARVLVIYTVGI